MTKKRRVRLRGERKPPPPVVLPENWRSLSTISLPQAALVVGIGRNEAYAAAKRKEIPAIRVGGLWRVPVPQLARMIDGVPGATPADVARTLRAQADFIEKQAAEAGAEGA
jgi:excisionase family DNA binding protein